MSFAKLRHQDHYIALTKELRDAGFDWREEFGGKHPRLLVDVNGKMETVTLSGSPSDCKTTLATKTQIRRRIRQWKANELPTRQSEAVVAAFGTLEKETMDDTAGLGETRVVQFHDADILTVDRAGEPYVAVKAMVDGMGLDWNGQYQRIRRDPVLSEAMCVMHMPTPGGRQEVVGLPLRMVNGFLFGIDSKRVKSSVRDLVIAYQRECYDVLAKHWLGGREASQVALTDDTQALLEMLADIRTAVISSHQSGQVTALEHIDGAKAAVLHYLKAYLKEPATAFYEDVRTRNVATYERDRRLIEGMESLTRTVSAMLAKAAPAIGDRPFIWTEWYDCDRLYSEWFPERHIPRRGLLSGIVSRALDRHCKATRKFHHMEHRIVGGKGVNWWHKDSVFNWLENGGRNLIATHLDRYSQEPRRPILTLVN